MRTLFLDTSALVKLYVEEAGTRALIAVATGSRLVTLDLARVEFASAAWRRQRAGDLSEAAASELVLRLVDDLEGVIERIDVTPSLVSHAMDLTRECALRAYDALHLAAALEADRSGLEPTFVAADDSLLEAAAMKRLRAWNPARVDHPP